MSVPQIRQNRLFDADTYQAARNYEPSEWEKSPDIVYHSSSEATMPRDKGVVNGSTGGGFHVGTKRAAEERIYSTSGNSNTKTIHPLQLEGQHALAKTAPRHPRDVADEEDVYSSESSDHAMAHGRNPQAWGDERANYSHAARQAVEVNRHTVPYLNEAEHQGSISYRAPRQNLKTWGEAVAADPNAPSRHKATVAHGYDLSHPMHTVGEGMPSDDMQLSMNLSDPGSGRAERMQGDWYADRRREANQTKPRLRRPAPPGARQPEGPLEPRPWR